MSDASLSPIWIGVAVPFLLPALPAGILIGLAATTYSPAELGQYYSQIHQSFQMLNEAIGQVKYSPCGKKLDIQAFRIFRDSWVAFYAQGPSRWFTLFSSDKAAADTFARGLVSWREKLASVCGMLSAPPVQGPVDRPWEVQQLPANDPDVQAAAQLKHDAKALADEIARLGLKPKSEFPWAWLLAGAGVLGVVMLVRRSRG
jgi:hypothetical protein